MASNFDRDGVRFTSKAEIAKTTPQVDHNGMSVSCHNRS
jgi:hypothetical protein